MNLPRTLSLLKKSARGVFSFKGWNCVPLAKGPKFGTDGNFAGSSYCLHVAWRRGLCSDRKFQGVLGWQNDANLPMDCHGWPVEFQEKIVFLREGRVVEFGLRSTIKFFRLLWETLARSVAQQVVRGWNMLESLNNRTLHFVCQLLEYASSSAMYCVHVPVQLLGWNVAQLASMKKRSLWYVKLKIHVESHILHHGCKHAGIKTLLVCTYKILNAQSEIELLN